METAFKMFNADLTCTMGRGRFQYEPGKWYEEAEANCVKNGFHAAKNPLDCLSYYHDFERSQCWIVAIDGDVDEDSVDSKVSAQRIRLLRRLTLSEFVVEACTYIMEHPELKYSFCVTEGPATASNNHFAISVCEAPKAKGKKGDVIGLLQTAPGSREIVKAACFIIDPEEGLKEDTYYDADMMEVKTE